MPYLTVRTYRNQEQQSTRKCHNELFRNATSCKKTASIIQEQQIQQYQNSSYDRVKGVSESKNEGSAERKFIL